MINYYIQDDKIYVSVPYVIKDDFKQEFRPRWISATKEWEVSKRAESKLKKYIEIAEKSLEERYKKIDEKAVEQRLKELLKRTSFLSESITNAINLENHLVEQKAKIKELKEIRDKLLLELESRKARILEKISQVANISEIESLCSSIDREMQKHGADAQKRFNSYQEKLTEICLALENIGIRHKKAHYMRYARFNRPDKDSLRFFVEDKDEYFLLNNQD